VAAVVLLALQEKDHPVNRGLAFANIALSAVRPLEGNSYSRALVPRSIWQSPPHNASVPRLFQQKQHSYE